MAMRIATAAWADPDEVESRYLYRDGTIWLGRSAGENQAPLGYRDDRHVCVVGGSRGGKGTTSIIPALATWPGSVCVLDPKGENATITAARRGGGSEHCKGLGQTVHVLDPFKAAQIDDGLRGRFNPLDALDPKSEEVIDEAGRVADAMVVMSDGVRDPFWDESARAMVKGLILHVLTSPDYEGRRNLITLRKLITRGDWETIEKLRAGGDDESNIPSAHGLLWQGLIYNPALDGLVAGFGDSFRNMLFNSPKQYESVLQTANRNTEFLDSPAAGHPVLMVLDEFSGLKRMEVIEHAVAQIAGYGVKMFFVLQSLEQLKGTYQENWETFLANSGLKVFFNLEDNFSRDYVSRLIGETEVIREVRSANESVSESESTSRSTSRSTSETRGRSSSVGASESEGTNSSVNTGTSGGVNTSRTKGKTWNIGESWTPTHYLLQALPGRDKIQRSDGKSWSKSETEGESRGWNEGRSDGVSRGTSRSQTDGTSESWTTGSSETEGTTRGTSQSRSSGASETIHKRALVTPDEIGQLFARIDDRAHQAYPGMALVVISGARPVAVRRVNYFEDFQFMGLFDPHPDHPFAGPKELTVDGRQMGTSLESFRLRIAGWAIKAGEFVAAGDDAAVVATKDGTQAAHIRVPRAGLIAAVPGAAAADAASGPLFSLLYYEDGATLLDPFAELRAFYIKVNERLAARKRELTEKRRLARIAALMFGFFAAIMLLAMVITQSATAGMILGMTGFAGVAAWMGSRVFRLSERLRDLDAARPGAPPENSLNDDGQALLPEAGVEAEPQPPAAPPEADQGGRTWRWVAVLIGLPVGLVLVVLAVRAYNSYQDERARAEKQQQDEQARAEKKRQEDAARAQEINRQAMHAYFEKYSSKPAKEPAAKK